MNTMTRLVLALALTGCGAVEAQAFLAAFHAMFRIAGITAAATGVLVAWSGWRRASR